MTEWNPTPPSALPPESGDPPNPIAPPAETTDPKPKAGKVAPKWETDTREQVRSAIRKFSKPLTDLIARDANEGDTRLLVTDFLTYGLGYDKYTDLTTEYQVKGEFADYGVRIDQQLIAFIEVKRCTTKLNQKHLRQVLMYAVNEGVEWIILTNGAIWQTYHVSGGLPVQVDLVFEVDLLGDVGPTKKADELFYLSRQSLKRRQIDELWLERLATSPGALARALLKNEVVDALRKELRRASGQNVAAEDLRVLLRETVLRAECLGPLTNR